MEPVHPRDRTYTQQDKLNAILNYIRNGYLGPLEQYPLGLDSWRRLGDDTDAVIKERICAILLDMMPKQAQE